MTLSRGILPALISTIVVCFFPVAWADEGPSEPEIPGGKAETESAPQLVYEVSVKSTRFSSRFYWISLDVTLRNEGDSLLRVVWSGCAYDELYRFRVIRGDGQVIPRQPGHVLPSLDALDPDEFKYVMPGGSIRLERGIHLTQAPGRSCQTFYIREPGVYTVESSFKAILVESVQTEGEDGYDIRKVWEGILHAEPITVTLEDERDPEKVARERTTIAGRVEDFDGNSIAGAQVFVAGRVISERGSSSHTGRFRHFDLDLRETGEGGRFRFERLTDEVIGYVLTTTHPNYGRAGTEIMNAPPKPEYDVLIRMEAGIEISGTVVDPDGKPVRGARVNAYRNSDRRVTYTDSAGRFELEGVVPKDGRVAVSLWKEGSSDGASAPPDKASSGDWVITLKRKEDLAVAGEAVFADGTPAPGVWLDFYLRPDEGEGASSIQGTNTDGEGGFATSFYHEPRGTVSGVVWAEERVPNRDQAHYRWRGSVEGVGVRQEDVRLVFENRGSVRVTVRPSGAIPPSRTFDVNCALLKSEPESEYGLIASRRLDSKGGTVDFQRLTAGKYHVGLRDTEVFGWKWSEEVTLPNEDGEFHAEVVFELPDLHLGGLRARVLEPDGKTPVANGNIWVSQPQTRARPIRDGRDEINEVPAGQVSVIVSVSGYDNVNLSATVKAGETTDLGDIVLASRDEIYGCVEGRVLYEDGTPVFGAQTVVCHEEQNVDVEGRYRLCMSPGERMLVIDVDDAPLWPRAPAKWEDRTLSALYGARILDFWWQDTLFKRVHVEAGKTVTENVVLDRSALADIEVSVVQESESPRQVYFTCGTRDQFFYCAASIPGGSNSCTLFQVPAGEQRIYLRDSNYCGYREFKNGKPNTRVVFDPENAGSISGRILGEGGNPVSGGSVELCIDWLLDIGTIEYLGMKCEQGPPPVLARVKIDDQGKFLFPKVDAGRYVVRPGRGVSPVSDRSAVRAQPVEVEPRSEVAIELSP